MRKRLLLVPIGIWIAFFAAALIFLSLPGVDLAAARLFFTPGVGFAFQGTPFERLVYHSVEWLTLWGSLGLIVLWAHGRLRSLAQPLLTGRRLIYLLLVLALGPGLIVNTVLKENWGRARPVDLAEFGGEQTFTAAFVPSDQGGGSFSSGHAAAAFYWMVVAMLIGGRNRWFWLAMTLTYGITVATVRMAAGGHYLSDVVVSFFIVLILALMLQRLLLRETEVAGVPRSDAFLRSRRDPAEAPEALD